MKFYIKQATEKDAELIAQLGVETFTEAFGHLYAHEDLVAFLKIQYHIYPPKHYSLEL